MLQKNGQFYNNNIFLTLLGYPIFYHKLATSQAKGNVGQVEWRDISLISSH